MSGNVTRAVQRSPKPNAAPALAYVAMRLGSAWEAPVTNPGPRSLAARSSGFRSWATATTVGLGGLRCRIDREGIGRKDGQRAVAAAVRRARGVRWADRQRGARRHDADRDPTPQDLSRRRVGRLARRPP